MDPIQSHGLMLTALTVMTGTVHGCDGCETFWTGPGDCFLCGKPGLRFSQLSEAHRRLHNLDSPAIWNAEMNR